MQSFFARTTIYQALPRERDREEDFPGKDRGRAGVAQCHPGTGQINESSSLPEDGYQHPSCSLPKTTTQDADMQTNIITKRACRTRRLIPTGRPRHTSREQEMSGGEEILQRSEEEEEEEEPRRMMMNSIEQLGRIDNREIIFTDHKMKSSFHSLTGEC